MAYDMVMTEQGKKWARLHFTHRAKNEVRSTFSTRDGEEYNRMLDGSIRRVTEKPYVGKSGRRKYIKQKRMEKESK